MTGRALALAIESSLCLLGERTQSSDLQVSIFGAENRFSGYERVSAC
jgi:hypothetical protein